MADARWERIKAVFAGATELPAERRTEFLDRECAGDAELRAEVESLLAARTMSAVRTGGAAAAVADSPTAAAGPLSEGPGTRIGPYKLLQLIGEGGFGSVFLAEQETPFRRRVALKIIKLGMDTRAVIARFEAERQALAMMDHPNIAKVLDAGATDSGRPYFVMELVRGVPITEYCDAANLTAAERLALAVPVCHAVQHAHQKGIIHRDLKPSNILVTLHDGKPVPKVIDFGIAKATASRLTEKTLFTEHRQMIGTPAYMSPEQAEMSGLDIDTRADVYSLGVLLYELLTGATPFDTRQLLERGYAEIQRVIREVEPPKPSTRVSTLGEGLAGVAARRGTEPRRLGLLLRGDLDWIVMKALEKDRTRRYDTAVGLAEDIGRHLRGEAVVAAPPSAGYRVRKFLRRNRGTVAAGAAIAAALMLGLVGTGAGLGRARAANTKLRQTLAFAQEHVGKLLLQQGTISSGSGGSETFGFDGGIGFSWTVRGDSGAKTIRFEPPPGMDENQLTRGLVYMLFISAFERYQSLETANARLMTQQDAARNAFNRILVDSLGFSGHGNQKITSEDGKDVTFEESIAGLEHAAAEYVAKSKELTESLQSQVRRARLGEADLIMQRQLQPSEDPGYVFPSAEELRTAYDSRSEYLGADAIPTIEAEFALATRHLRPISAENLSLLRDAAGRAIKAPGFPTARLVEMLSEASVLHQMALDFTYADSVSAPLADAVHRLAEERRAHPEANPAPAPALVWRDILTGETSATTADELELLANKFRDRRGNALRAAVVDELRERSTNISAVAGASEYRHDAEFFATQALAADPRCGGCATALALAKFRIGEYKEALAAAETASALLRQSNAAGPFQPAALALIHARLGNTSEARAALAQLKALLSDPSNAETWGSDRQAASLLAEAESLIDPPKK